MKKFALLATVAIATMIGITSCDNRPNIKGTWEGDAKTIIQGSATSMVKATYTFNQDGSVALDYTIDLTQPMPATDSIVEPYEISVAATASQAGTWQYVKNEDDEVLITLDPANTVVVVDPNAVEFRSVQFTDGQEPTLIPLRQAICESITRSIKASLPMQTIMLNDVEVNKPIMKFEINDVDYVFTSVNQ